MKKTYQYNLLIMRIQNKDVFLVSLWIMLIY